MLVLILALILLLLLLGGSLSSLRSCSSSGCLPS